MEQYIYIILLEPTKFEYDYVRPDFFKFIAIIILVTALKTKSMFSVSVAHVKCT